MQHIGSLQGTFAVTISFSTGMWNGQSAVNKAYSFLYSSPSLNSWSPGCDWTLFHSHNSSHSLAGLGGWIHSHCCSRTFDLKLPFIPAAPKANSYTSALHNHTHQITSSFVPQLVSVQAWWLLHPMFTFAATFNVSRHTFLLLLASIPWTLSPASGHTGCKHCHWHTSLFCPDFIHWHPLSSHSPTSPLHSLAYGPFRNMRQRSGRLRGSGESPGPPLTCLCITHFSLSLTTDKTSHYEDKIALSLLSNQRAALGITRLFISQADLCNNV